MTYSDDFEPATERDYQRRIEQLETALREIHKLAAHGKAHNCETTRQIREIAYLNGESESPPVPDAADDPDLFLSSNPFKAQRRE